MNYLFGNYSEFSMNLEGNYKLEQIRRLGEQGDGPLSFFGGRLAVHKAMLLVRARFGWIKTAALTWNLLGHHTGGSTAYILTPVNKLSTNPAEILPTWTPGLLLNPDDCWHGFWPSRDSPADIPQAIVPQATLSIPEDPWLRRFFFSRPDQNTQTLQLSSLYGREYAI